MSGRISAIEPTHDAVNAPRDGFEDCCPSRETPGSGEGLATRLPRKAAGSDSPSIEVIESGRDDPDLNRLVTAWDTLPDQIRAAMVTLLGLATKR